MSMATRKETRRLSPGGVSVAAGVVFVAAGRNANKGQGTLWRTTPINTLIPRRTIADDFDDFVLITWRRCTFSTLLPQPICGRSTLPHGGALLLVVLPIEFPVKHRDLLVSDFGLTRLGVFGATLGCLVDRQLPA
jgi:hypothetical protein